jgi:hypothetical protein
MATLNGFALIRESDNAVMQNWLNIPERVELDDDEGQALVRVDSPASGWTNGTYIISPYSWTVIDPPPVVPSNTVISDRQFYQQLAIQSVITQNEALSAVQIGALPSSLASLVAALPADQQFGAKMLLCGATQFIRSNPLVAVFGAAFGWNTAQIDALWAAAYQL